MTKIIAYVVALGLLGLFYIGPGGWLRGDVSEAAKQESAAEEAEKLAGTPPELGEEEAELAIETLKQKLLIWNDSPTFWDGFFPAFPEGLLLEQLSRSEAEEVDVGVHKRDIYFQLTLSNLAENELGVVEGIPAPAGLDGSVEWLILLKERYDIRLNSLRVVDNGVLEAGLTVYFIDPLPEEISEEVLATVAAPTS